MKLMKQIMSMTDREEELFKIFDSGMNDNYFFEFDNGDSFIVILDGFGESELNPLTGEDVDTYIGYAFRILEVKTDVTGNYCKDALIEISKYLYPSLIADVTTWKTLRRTKTHCCKKCGGHVFSICDYPDFADICMECDFGVASSVFLPIQEDMNVYTLTVTDVPEYNPEQLKGIKKAIGLSYLEIKNKMKPGYIIAKDIPIKIFPLKRKLEECGVKMKVSPEVMYPEVDIRYISNRYR